MKTLAGILNTLVMITAGAAISAGAHANVNGADKYRTRSVTVKYNDLNLSRKAGVDTLYKRLRAAGDRVCGPMYNLDSVNPMEDWKNWHACYKQALDNAAAKVGNQQLSQMINRETGTSAIVAERD